MKRIAGIFSFLVLYAHGAYSQEQGAPQQQKGQPEQETYQEIQIREADLLKGQGEGAVSIVINGVFEHEDAVMWCDSAFMDNQQNTLEAFGNVKIVKADTVTLTSDKLFYDGNTRFATARDNITLTDRQAVLTTDHMTFDMVKNLSTYYDGGQIVNETDTLTSKTGYYYTTTKDAYFRKDAVAVTEEAVIRSDTLHYNTENRMSYFYGPTTIEGEDDLIYAENGSYDTELDQASFQENAWYQSGDHLLKGDSLYYDRKIGFGRALGNVHLIDTAQQVVLQGEIGEYSKTTEEAFVTERAQVMLFTEQDTAATDTIFMAADTLKTRLLPAEQVKKWIGVDSILLGRPLSDLDEPEVDAIREIAPELVPGADTLLSDTLGVPEVPGADTIPDSLSYPKDIPSDTLQRPPGLIKDQFKLKGEEEQEQEAKSKREQRRAEREKRRAERRKAREERRQERAEKRKQKAERDAERSPEPEEEAGKDPERALRDSLPDVTPDTIPTPRQVFEQGIDSLFHGLDSLRARHALEGDSAKVPAPEDAQPDSVRVLFAFKNVRIFKSDVQAIADSVVFTGIDSLIRCYRDPVIWSNGSQITGEYMNIALKDKKIDKTRIYRMAMMISEVDIDSTKYHQMSGKNMVGTFKGGELTELLVEGNARTIYYVPEDSLSLMGINYAENSSSLLLFKEGELDIVKLLKDVDQTTYPLWDREAKTRLDGFYLREPERPKDRYDIFRKAERTPRPARDPSEPEALQATELEELIPEEPEPAEGETEGEETEETGEPIPPTVPETGEPFDP